MASNFAPIFPYSCALLCISLLDLTRNQHQGTIGSLRLQHCPMPTKLKDTLRLAVIHGSKVQQLHDREELPNLIKYIYMGKELAMNTAVQLSSVR